MKSSLYMLLLLSSFAIAAVEESPYAGHEQREIKSLSKSEIDGYLAGGGMGFAKAAELNHYPGPKHVLELATELELNEQQLARTEQIYQSMQQQAVELGQQLVDKEGQLDQLFASSTITSNQLKDRLADIAALQAKIRFVHLVTHLEQRTVLSDNQVRQYDRLRGYANGRNKHELKHD